MPSSDAVEAWADSGAMALTGRPDGAPVLPPGNAATVVREQLGALGIAVPGLLGERAAYAGLRRNGPWSCGGAMRVLPTADGLLALSLPRASDLELLPALVEAEVTDPWATAATWAIRTPTADAVARVGLLGLAGGAVSALPEAPRPGVVATALGTRRPSTERPLVVDLTSLWAGPLCAHLLGLRGARVVKVESRHRPDGARRGPADFFALLHRGHEQVHLDFGGDLDVLRDLVREADLVLEASRPRALRHLGLVAEDVVAAGTSWLSITARGRASDRVGFGDDVAASAGLVHHDGGDVLPVADALADPLAGVAAASAAADALAAEEARLVDVSMWHVAAATRGDVPEHDVTRSGGAWWVECAAGRYAVREPRTRP
jgi:hypothetical protein